LRGTTANGRLVFAIFAGLAEFERALIAERTKAGLAVARARGRKGGRPFKLTSAKLRLAAMGRQPGTKVGDLCTELGITRQTLYRFVSPRASCAMTATGSCSGARPVRSEGRGPESIQAEVRSLSVELTSMTRIGHSGRLLAFRKRTFGRW
jgi:transposase-like protein